MKIKQQKQIQCIFNRSNLGTDRGRRVVSTSKRKLLNTRLSKTQKIRSKNQMKTLIQYNSTPHCTVQGFVNQSGLSQEDVVYKHMRKYMLDIVADKEALIYGENGVDTGILCTLQQHNSLKLCVRTDSTGKRTSSRQGSL